MCVGLGTSVYLWSASTCQVSKLCDLVNENDTVTSVSWSDRVSFFMMLHCWPWNIISVPPTRCKLYHWYSVFLPYGCLGSAFGSGYSQWVCTDLGCSCWEENCRFNRTHCTSRWVWKRVSTTVLLVWALTCVSIIEKEMYCHIVFKIKADSRAYRVKITLADRCCSYTQTSGHSFTVGSLSWGGDLLCSGSRDHSILAWDHRSPVSPVKKYLGHTQEVCGLRWSPDHQLLASGGNDNKVSQCSHVRIILWLLIVCA